MKMMLNMVVAVCLLAVTNAMAVEAGVVLKDEILRKEPFGDAKPSGKLKAGQKVTIEKKDGGWLSVKSGAAKGWVRMLSVRQGSLQKSRNVADSLKSLASGRSGTGHVVATTGIRGLDEEDLKTAKFNASELDKAESYAVSREAAMQFAAQGKLKPRQVEYLPVLQ